MEKREYKTDDIYIAAAIAIAIGEPPTYHRDHDRIYFHFSHSERLHEVLHAYIADDLMVSALGYAAVVRRLKAEVMERKNK